jgi:polysaccharide biosynthesis/export protein
MMGRKKLIWILGALLLPLLFASSCSVQPKQARASVGSNKAVLNLQNSAEQTNKSPKEYLLGYGDVVEVKFFKNPEYNDTVSVRPDGRISLQRVGDIYVMGMETKELDKIVTDTYAQILLEPDVTIIVREFGGQQFYVMGEVHKPGMYEVGKGMTILRALASAGGPTDKGKLNSVILLRSDDYGKAEATRLNMDISELRETLARDIPIQSYDVVYVPKTFIADVSVWVTQVYDIILRPLDIWTRYQYWN